jgi:orotidine-5'-phosphate decarboxylase
MPNGLRVVDILREHGAERIFLDLKFHDIPNTVAQACKAAARLGVWMLNVHAAGGPRMLAAAREAVETGPARPLLIAVTVLTSMGSEELQAIGVDAEPQQQVLRLAGLTRDAGLDGVVCAALEAPALRREMGVDFRLVTPGIRPAGSATGDQKRIMTPARAIAAGADYLVVGRPVMEAADPKAAAEAIHAEVAQALT